MKTVKTLAAILAVLAVGAFATFGGVGVGVAETWNQTHEFNEAVTLNSTTDVNGVMTFDANPVWTNGVLPTTAAKTASFTLSDAVDVYRINSAGGAITVTLPTPTTMTAGNTWVLCLQTAGNAVTLNGGTYSINGAVTDSQMDAAGDCEFVTVDSAGYYLIGKNIH